MNVSSPRNAGPTENVRGALALGDAGASCPSNPAGPLGGPGQKTKRPAATIAGAGSATALAAFVKRPQAEAQIGAADTHKQREARSQPIMLWDGLSRSGGKTMHRSQLAGFIIDCQTDDLAAAADFWSRALGLPRRASTSPEDTGYALLETKPNGLHVEVQK